MKSCPSLSALLQEQNWWKTHSSPNPWEKVQVSHAGKLLPLHFCGTWDTNGPQLTGITCCLKILEVKSLEEQENKLRAQSKRPEAERKSPTEVELTFDGADVKNIGAYREGKKGGEWEGERKSPGE